MSRDMVVTHETLGETIEERFLDEDEGAAPYGVPDADAVAEQAALDMARDEAEALDDDGRIVEMSAGYGSFDNPLDVDALDAEKIQRALDGEPPPAEPGPVVPAQTGPNGSLTLSDEPRRFKRVLVCKMYPEELAKKAVLLADAITDHDVYEAQKKEVAADMASVLAAKWEEVKRLSRVVHQGGEEREVECELVRNDREGSIETVRLDTGEVIDRRAQDVEERQLPLTAVVSPREVPTEGDAEAPGEDRETRAQCATTRDGEQCEGVCEGDAAYCPECIADAVARDDAAEAERAAARPRCAVGDCEEEAGASGYCGQHDRTEASTSPATPKAKGKGRRRG